MLPVKHASDNNVKPENTGSYSYAAYSLQFAFSESYLNSPKKLSGKSVTFKPTEDESTSAPPPPPVSEMTMTDQDVFDTAKKCVDIIINITNNDFLKQYPGRAIKVFLELGLPEFYINDNIEKDTEQETNNTFLLVEYIHDSTTISPSDKMKLFDYLITCLNEQLNLERSQQQRQQQDEIGLLTKELTNKKSTIVLANHPSILWLTIINEKAPLKEQIQQLKNAITRVDKVISSESPTTVTKSPSPTQSGLTFLLAKPAVTKEKATDVEKNDIELSVQDRMINLTSPVQPMVNRDRTLSVLFQAVSHKDNQGVLSDWVPALNNTEWVANNEKTKTIRFAGYK